MCVPYFVKQFLAQPNNNSNIEYFSINIYIQLLHNGNLYTLQN